MKKIKFALNPHKHPDGAIWIPGAAGWALLEGANVRTAFNLPDGVQNISGDAYVTDEMFDALTSDTNGAFVNVIENPNGNCYGCGS